MSAVSQNANVTLTAPGTAPTVLEFTPTSDEVATGLADLMREDVEFQQLARTEYAKRLVRVLMVWLGFGSAVIVLPLLAFRFRFESPWIVFFATAGAPFLLHLITRTSFATYAHTKAGQLAWRHTLKKAWLLCAPTRIELLEDGLRITYSDRDLRLGWAAIARCTRSPSGVVLAFGRLDGFVIPESAFTEATQASTFAETVNERILAAGCDLDHVAARALASSDLNCPQCRYNMRGAASARCPECGIQVDWELLKRTQRASNV